MRIRPAIPETPLSVGNLRGVEGDQTPVSRRASLDLKATGAGRQRGGCFRRSTRPDPEPRFTAQRTGAVAPAAFARKRWRVYSAANAALSSSAVSVGVLPTLTPAASRASFFACAVPAEPDTMAPAWPMVLPSGAVKPAT